MAKIASIADFETAQGYYWEPGQGIGYRDYPFFAEYAQFINNRYPVATYNQLVVAACGWGYSVKHLVEDYGRNAYGFDVAQYCKDKAQQLFAASIYNRIYLTDMSNSNAIGDFLDRKSVV